MVDPFSLAVKAGLAKRHSLKDYLVKDEGKTDDQVEQIIQELEGE